MREQLSFVACEHAQQVVLGRRQRDGTAADCDETLDQVDLQLADLEHGLAGRRRPAQRRP